LPETKTEIGQSDGQVTELVTRYVRGLILAGELRPGQRLPPERELVTEIGVSRTSVRAGLRSLAAKGVLLTKHGAGTFIAEGPPVLDSEPLSFLAALHGFTPHEMFEARRTLEVGVAGLAATHATGDQLLAIAEEVTGMFASLEDPQTFLVHDIRFHRAVAAASGNPILVSLVQMVSVIFYELCRRTADQTGDQRPGAEMHRVIYQAIRARDRSRAQRLMCDHLLEAEREHEQEQKQRATQQDPAAVD
jgi:GntR family transcriptional regulator, transcriptional repressor for pyruvate dehydrogenase complex